MFDAVEEVVVGVGSRESVVGNGVVVTPNNTSQEFVGAKDEADVAISACGDEGLGRRGVVGPEDFGFGLVEVDVVMCGGSVEDCDSVMEVVSDDG